MTYDDDYIQIEVPGATRRLFCRHVGLAWPPPERLWLDDAGLRIANDDDDENAAAMLVRDSMSIISDEQRADMTHVCRGALYRPAA